MSETATAVEDQPVDPPPAGNRIVVGIDGSQGSLDALTWALREARLRDATVHAVLGWDHHPSWDGTGLGSMFPMGYTTTGGALGGGLGGARIAAPTAAPVGSAPGSEVDGAALANSLLDQAIGHAVDEDAAETPVRITREAVQGHGARVLLDVVTESDLLVVGSRGHGAFLGALLGSVSHHVVAQAPCPVVVVPDRQRAPSPE